MPRRTEPGHRGDGRRACRSARRREAEAAVAAGRAGRGGVARCRPGRPGPAAARVRRRWSTATSRNWPSWRWPRPGTRSPAPAGRRATSATCCCTTPAAPERLSGRQIPVAGGLDVTFHEPLGVVGVIVPWNFPMPIAAWGFAPALAAGNAVVLKPAEPTPLTAMRLGRAGPGGRAARGRAPGVPGRAGGGPRLVEHRTVRKIVLHRLAAVGQQIMADCARQVKRVTLELGGKSPNIVFADADLERAAATAPYAVFDNAGQDCCARSRILVQRPVFDRFMELFEPAVRGVVVGDPADAEDRDGPADLGRAAGPGRGYVPPDAPVAFRGQRRRTGAGFWYPPTVLAAGPAAATELPAEEVFGPVACRGPVRGRGRRDRGWPTPRRTGCPGRSGPGTRAGPSGWPGRWRPATCR